MGFEDFDPIIGEVKAEWGETGPKSGEQLNPCLFRIYVDGRSQLKFHVTDFRSYTWEAVKSIHQLEDMRDYVGIGGQLSEFMDYFIISFRSGDVKLVYEGSSKSNGAAHSKLVAQKSRGMPLISISLSKLMNPEAGEAMANLSLELYKAFRDMKHSFVKEQERCCQLTSVISAEKEKSQTIKNQLDALVSSKRMKLNNTSPDIVNLSMLANSDTSSVTLGQNFTEKQPTAEVQSSKIASRVVPAYRRSKVRGAVLQDTEEGEEN